MEEVKNNVKSKAKKPTVKKKKLSKTSTFSRAKSSLDSRFNSAKKSSKNVASIASQIEEGKNMYLRFNRTEKSNFDLAWIKKIEDAIPSIDEIIKNPRINTKNVANVVPIELARKTTSESIQHLATHSQFVKEIDRDGNVIPSKILNIGTEDEILTYENKFIATLIRKLVLFIEKRYEYILKYAPLQDYEVLYIKNHSYINGVEYQIESKVISSKVSKTDNNEVNNEEFLKKVRFIRKYAYYFYTSPFMKNFKNEKNVRGPIIQTNIIRKNPRYRKCYELYKFMDKYDKLGVNFVVNEEFLTPSKEDISSYQNIALLNAITLKGEDALVPFKKKMKKSSPKIINTIDDDIFTFYPIGSSPEFIRVDEEYLKYKERNTKLLKTRPKEPERKFNIGNYLTKGKLKKEEERRKELLRRKKKEESEFLKEQKLLAIKEEKERARLLELKRKEEEARRISELEEIRKAIKEEAKLDSSINEEALEKERLLKLEKENKLNEIIALNCAVESTPLLKEEELPEVNKDESFLEIDEVSVDEDLISLEENDSEEDKLNESLKEENENFIESSQNEENEKNIKKSLQNSNESFNINNINEKDTSKKEENVDQSLGNNLIKENESILDSLNEDETNLLDLSDEEFNKKILEKIKKLEEESNK